MIKLIIFDFDGVIIEGSNEGYFRCYHKALEDVGIILEPDEERKRILAKWGTGYKAQLAYLLREYENLIPAAIKAYEHYYYDTNLFIQDIKLIPGAKDALERLSQSYKLAIATGMMRKTLDKFLDKFTLNMFDLVSSIDEVKKEKDRKPSPFMLNKTMQAFRLTPNETVYVGDADSDVKMAKNANVVPIVVLTGHLNREEAEKLSVEHIIDNIALLERELQKIE